MREPRLSQSWNAGTRALDAVSERLFERWRPDMARRLSSRERLIELVAGAGFALAAAALVVAGGPYAAVPVGQAAVLVVAFALLARSRIAIGVGFTAPTELAVVPMVMLLPPALAPSLVAAGLLLDLVPDLVTRRRSPERVLTALADGWYMIAPAALLAVVAPDGALAGTSWPWWLAALALQGAGELVSSVGREWLGRGVPVAEHAAAICEVGAIDVLLSPVGLLAAFASQSRPYAFVLVVPLAVGFAVFVRDRAGRIDRALALADDLERERNAVVESERELRESRDRIVKAGDIERRKIERDLHDGAQRRLAGLLLTMQLLRPAATGETSALLDDLEQGIANALGELRTLAAGILPPVLSDSGLPAALEELSSSTPLPMAIRADGVGRLPPQIEQAAYFVLAEAVANMIKHAHATSASASVSHRHGVLVVEVADDGVGGADPSGGGLRGLTDRVASLNGRLFCTSPPGHGTIVHAEIPCGR